MCSSDSIRVPSVKAMRWTALIVALMLAVPVTASAQEDTTPPVLLDFTISPTVFDTGPGPVVFDICATASDGSGPSGLRSFIVAFQSSTSTPVNLSFGFQPSGSLLDTECVQVSLPQFLPYDTIKIFVAVQDLLINQTNYSHPDISQGQRLDLCPIGTCELVNRPEFGLPDGDSDGIPDDADNCPGNSNPNQRDRDLDLFGDVCDPFPDDRDNEQAQCELDLETCLAALASDQCQLDLAQCSSDLAQTEGDLSQCTADLGLCGLDLAGCDTDLAQCDSDLSTCLTAGIPDADGDGETDSTDACPDTSPGVEVDDAGCSLEQFCSGFDGAKDCSKADWQNDEPSMTGKERDCTVDRGKPKRGDDKGKSKRADDKGKPKRGDDRCVPR